MEALSSDCKEAPAGTAVTAINVIFHGTFAFVAWKHVVEVLIPEVNDHCFEAGTVLSHHEDCSCTYDALCLYPLEQGGEYKLFGALPDTPKCFDSTKCVALSNRPTIRRDRIRATLNLPHPDQIYSLRCLSNGGLRFFEGVDAPQVQATELATAHVFVYESVAALNHIALEPLPWCPQLNYYGTANLHVFAEPKVTMPAELALHHMEDASDDLFNLIEGLDLRIKAPPDGFPKPCPADPRLPYGVTVCDLANLAEIHAQHGKLSVATVNPHNCVSASLNNAV